ncbi:MAG TPA: hypothetical protein VEC01_11385 [Noviherbaspirillum sp.]|uniref:hypothetical protein n=1 Tax=Noviherbaspirillum sp. TaxID=1926288 RepID=UPI002D351E9A|nr:hypothetical protein [Noviherbaspirillum sp.]HYD95920.1 hypothetical protein [Noviherbaspirillum sp.]
MKLSRRSRIVSALFALISVLFMQLAAAAYACPPGRVVQLNEAATMAMAMAGHEAMASHEGMEECDGLIEDDAPPALCYSATQVADQSLNKPAPDLPPSVAVVLVPAVADVNLAYRPVAPPARTALLARDSSPPLSIRNCCFRF